MNIFPGQHCSSSRSIVHRYENKNEINQLDQYQSDLHRNRSTVLHVGIDKSLHYNTSETILLVDS